MTILIHIGLAVCVFALISGMAVLLYRLIEVLLDYVGYGPTTAARRYARCYAAAEKHANRGAPTLNRSTSLIVQRALTAARRGDGW